MVQDLWIISETVVPLHPTVPNPYVILGKIPPSAKWFTVLDLKDAFFCIPLAKESQYLFAFEWEAPEERHQQMTWTVLPQGFRDSPHRFGQALSWDLLDLDLGPNGKIVQYVVRFSSVQFSRSVVSNSLQPHELQHFRPPCPSPTSRAYPNPCPLNW